MPFFIQPVFDPDDPTSNALELCELFLLQNETEVPVDSFVIVSDGQEHATMVGPGTYQSALFLFYLLTKTGSPMFDLTAALRPLVGEYFGRDLIAAAAHPATRHTTVRALLGQTVSVRLTLKPGYRASLADGRSLKEIIERAWERCETIHPWSKEPLLRQALQEFFEQLEAKTLCVENTGPDHWPTPLWADRALVLERQLAPT